MSQRFLSHAPTEPFLAPDRWLSASDRSRGVGTRTLRTENVGLPANASAIISPMDPLPVEALLEDYPPPMHAIAQHLRDIVKATIPDAIERVRPGWHLIGYDVPVGRRTAYFAYVAPEAEHVHLGFEHGAAMRDPRRLLLGAGVTKQVRWLTFRDGDPIDERACAELLREAARVATMTRGERILQAMDADADRD